MKVFSRATVERMRKTNDVLMEKHALARLSHPNIVKLLYTWGDVDNCYIVTELCRGGELWQFCAKVGATENEARPFFLQIMSAVEYMHRMGIVHRDLKAENIFLSSSHKELKIGDFGSGRDIFNPNIAGAGNANSRGSVWTHYVGTPNFMAPEAISNEENDELSDIWSLGCLFYQILLGLPPFVAGSEYLVFLRVRALDLQFPSTGLSKTAIDLVRSIVTTKRSDRPNITKIKSHAFFTGTFAKLKSEVHIQKELKAIANNSNFELTESFIGQFKPTVWGDDQDTVMYMQNKLRMIGTIRQWERLSAPGAGTQIIDHLSTNSSLHMSQDAVALAERIAEKLGLDVQLMQAAIPLIEAGVTPEAVVHIVNEFPSALKRRRENSSFSIR